ncbi:MAG TPA: hypothetical protein VF191_07800 [Cyclobacteriaceae bacterium]
MRKMKKLEDIPRKNIFDVPEGYFDQLPARVQARVSASSRRRVSWSWTNSLRYALPVLVAIALVTGWWLKQAPEDPEAILASIEAEQLAAYLEENGLVTEDLIPYEDLTADDATAIESEVYDAAFEESELELLLDELPLDAEELKN